MVLKQRFADGRTYYQDLGNHFSYIQQVAEEFNRLCEINKMDDKQKSDCVGFIYPSGDTDAIPIFKDFPQWIYSNDGKLFMNLV